jgi:hypothetical protein
MLANYPQPQFILFENGNAGGCKLDFKQMCDNYDIKAKPTKVTTNITQANAIIEQVHKVVNDMLRSFYLERNHENLEDKEDNPF